MSEVRLIDAVALRKAMYHEAMEKDSDEQKWESGCWIRYKMFERVLKTQPTIDPVKHGRWIDRRSIAAPNRYECSVCKRMTIVDECMGEPIYCYCPWCGAKMDEREGEEDEL